MTSRRVLALLFAMPLFAMPLFAMAPLVWPLLASVPASAQDYDRPPPGYGGGGAVDGYGDAPVDAPSPSGLSGRVSRLESRIREMTGQIEELQNANRKLVEQLQKFQGDVDGRLSSGGGTRPRRSEATPPTSDVAPELDTQTATPKARKPRRDDAFDPDSAPPSDPGRPKPLGSIASSQPDDGGNAPMDLSGARLRRNENNDTIAPTLRLPSTTPRSAAGTVGTQITPDGTVIANTAPATPQGEYEVALGYYRDKQFENAEKGFTAFIAKNPKSKRVAEATFYLGESYDQRGRSREAAEQYLKISTEYAGSSRAPDAMLHLGMSLKAIGAKEQACAAFSEINKKYPNAPTYVRSGAEREAKRAQC